MAAKRPGPTSALRPASRKRVGTPTLSHRTIYVGGVECPGPWPALIFVIKAGCHKKYAQFFRDCERKGVHYFPVNGSEITCKDESGNQVVRYTTWECLSGDWDTLDWFTNNSNVSNWYALTNFRPPAMARNKADLDHPIHADSPRVKRNIIRHGWSQRRLSQTEERERLDKLPTSNQESPYHLDTVKVDAHRKYLDTMRDTYELSQDSQRFACEIVRISAFIA